ncbi:hypothetical protein CEW83_15320 [Parazoarcus communis]|uniref:Histidine kinase n=1 Tax=Parazoarcus communis TaxID=41977 RepID=A0A2U8GS64_9RHOO|nr:FIST N-terminal domain-containing protein [Parazoarcus communis]AWI76411.1 hypothetical protein CEW83_15320 [Parazoarcus communis]
MSISPFIAAHDNNPDWRTALNHCLEQLTRAAKADAGAAPVAEYTLGWCYLTDPFADAAEAILAELRQHLPGVSWVGTVGIGIAASGVEYIDEPAIALMLAPMPRPSFRLFSGRQPLPMTPEAGAFNAHTALVHADGTTPDLQELLPELAERTATGYLFGGLSSARTHTLQIADAVLTGGLSGVAFGEEVGLLSRVTQGCQPMGPARQVTRAEDNNVLTLDGQPALACALQDLGLANDLAVEEMAEALSSTLVGLCRSSDDQASTPARFGPDTLVRHIIGLDPRARVLAIGDEVETGAQLTFCRRNPKAALEDVRRIATEIRDELETSKQRAAGAIYVSCVGRGGPHFGTPDAELSAIRDVLGELPLVGFFANGEIARDRLYGYTGVLSVFTMAA